MADFFDNDEVTKGYDPAIARRIFSYLKPYRGLAAAALVALAVATAGELLLPVLVRDTVDRALTSSWVALDARVVDRPEAAALEIAPADPRIGRRLFLPERRLAALSGTEREALRADGLVEADSYYLVEIDPEDEAQAASLAARPYLFEREGDHAAIALSALRSLPGADARALRRTDELRVSRNAAWLFAVLVAVLAATFVQVFLASLVGQKVMKDLRVQLFRHVSSRSLAFLSRQPVGRLVTRMTSDVETVNQFFTDVVAAFLKDASLMVGVLAVLLALDWRLGLITLATLPPIAVATGISRRKARDAFRRQRTWLSKVNAYLAERLSGIAVVKLFAGEARSRREFEERDRELMRANLGEMYVFATFRPLVDLFASLSVAVILYFGAGFHLSKLVSLGTLMAFVNLIRMFYAPVQDISEKYTLLQSAMAGAERVFKLLDAEERIPDEPRRPMPDKVRGHIEFDKVSFSYKEGEPILRELSFKVEPGEMVAIVGPTGAGKTTIANLITRLWDVQGGEIRIDGVPVRDLPLDGLRKAVQPVLQDVFLFSGSVEENIRLGAEVGEERMRLAARTVHAEEFIERLPEGYKTVLAEGASDLSAGQRQILSFARVLAHDPAVIILDEATSSVDTETELMIQRGLEALLAGRTSVVIAHRLSTIRHADRIVVLAGGRVAEEGRHEELLAKRGLYWNLYRLQYGGGEGAEREEIA